MKIKYLVILSLLILNACANHSGKNDSGCPLGRASPNGT